MIKSCYVTTERLSKRKIQIQEALIIIVSCVSAAATVSYVPATQTQSLALTAPVSVRQRTWSQYMVTESNLDKYIT